jgi:geranylgeranyl reductase family protein
VNIAQDTCDVAVVGAGPSGSHCARLLAERGHRVLLLEKHPKTRTHIICTGIVGAEGFSRFCFPRDPVLFELSRARFVSPGGNTLDYGTPQPFAFVVDRSRFDAHLQEEASRQGALLRYGFQAEEVEERRGEILIHGRNGNGREQLRARIAVFANGFNPRLARSLGLPLPTNIIQGVQAELRVRELDHALVFFGRRIAPGFFAWVVPIGRGRARVGLLARENSGKYFKAFLDTPALKALALEKPSAVSSRPILQGLPARTSGSRFLVLGEAAGQVKTSTSGGIYYGLLCAELAAQVASQALESAGETGEILGRYHQRWSELLAGELKAGLELQRLGRLLEDHDIDSLFRLIGSNGLFALCARRINFDWHAALINFALRHPTIAGWLGTQMARRLPDSRVPA